jgi:hypothetical protein
MLDIGRLAHRNWCGKMRGKRRLQTYDEKLVASQDAFRGVRLTSIVDPDKIPRLVFRQFAIAIIKSRMGR